MHNETKRAEHTKLVLKMAETQGVDIAELVMRAEMSMDDVEDAVDKCLGCLHPDTCKQMLATATSNMVPPEFCRNADVFARLKPE